MTRQHPQFDNALKALDGGLLQDLTRILDDYPELVTELSFSKEGCYTGYFYRPTLLHHVAGNPTRGPIPSNIVEITRLLIDRGSDIDAFCGGGPSQPTSGGGTVLGLVASGAAAQLAGQSIALLDLLLERGATMDFVGDGGLMWTCLYHTVENRGQTQIAHHLVKHGHKVDFCFAAGLGMMGELKSFINKDDSISSDADFLYRNHRPAPVESNRDLWQDALLFAAICDQKEIAEFALLNGANINSSRPWGHAETVTPLHGAAWAGNPGMSTFLLNQGADRSIKDPQHKSTPLEWARHCNREEAAEAILNWKSN